MASHPLDHSHHGHSQHTAVHEHGPGCSHAGDKPAAPSAHAHHAHGGGPISSSFQATLHCLTGCVIGEVAGVAIGVTLGLEIWMTIALATTLAYISGFTLGVLPVMKSQNLAFWPALRLIWLGEAISIGVMEIVMNTVDYQMGGIGAPSIFHWSFWNGFLYAIPAGFLAAWPVNWWLLSRNIKKHCH
jgi:hypothetical protein